MADISESFDAIKIGVLDSRDRADLFMDISCQLVRLGFLLDALRAPEALKPHIGAAARICHAAAQSEIMRMDRGISLMKSLCVHPGTGPAPAIVPEEETATEGL